MSKAEDYLNGEIGLRLYLEAIGVVDEQNASTTITSERDLEAWAESIQDSLFSFANDISYKTDYDPGTQWDANRTYIGSIDYSFVADQQDIDVSVVFLENEVEVTVEGNRNDSIMTYDYNTFNEDDVFDQVNNFLM